MHKTGQKHTTGRSAHNRKHGIYINQTGLSVLIHAQPDDM